MKNIIKKLALLMIVMVCNKATTAQLTVTTEAQKIQAAYKAKKQLSFSMAYTYAQHNNPAAIIDSASGSFVIDGFFYWGKINGTEFMQNQTHAVQVVDEAELMRVALPDSTSPLLITAATFDSALGSGTYTNTIATTGTLRTINLQFADAEAPYASFSITYDTTTYLMQKIEMVKNELDEDTELLTQKLFTMRYSNYSFKAPDAAIFNSSGYFVKNGNEFLPQPPYTNYKVFIASPELTK
jgi:hypothetical protein